MALESIVRLFADNSGLSRRRLLANNDKCPENAPRAPRPSPQRRCSTASKIG